MEELAAELQDFPGRMFVDMSQFSNNEQEEEGEEEYNCISSYFKYHIYVLFIVQSRTCQ